MELTEIDGHRGRAPAEPETSWPLLGALLLERGLLDEQQLEHALALQSRSGKLIGEILVDCGFVTRFALARVLAQQYGFELEQEVGYGVAQFFPESAARTYAVLPVRLDRGVAIVAAAGPTDDATLAEIRRLLAREARFVRVDGERLRGAIERTYEPVAP
jgi:type IV pilus assembly protein PilB